MRICSLLVVTSRNCHVKIFFKFLLTQTIFIYKVMIEKGNNYQGEDRNKSEQAQGGLRKKENWIDLLFYTGKL